MPLSLAAVLGLGGCSNDTEPMTELSLQSAAAVCKGQRAQVPAGGAMNVVLAGNAARTKSADYVALTLTDASTYAYLSFAPDLPDSFTSEEARAKLTYAYFIVEQGQPAEIGGEVAILSGNDTIQLADFDQLEVKDGWLLWHAVQQNPGSYWKQLSVYDEDTTNDPPSGADCLADDVVGVCSCEFGGPAMQVELAGAFPLSVTR